MVQGERCRIWDDVRIVAEHSEPIQLEIAAESKSKITSCTIERLVYVAESRKKVSLRVQDVAAVIVKSADAQRSMIMRTRCPCRLHLFAHSRILFQVELLENVSVNILAVVG